VRFVVILAIVFAYLLAPLDLLPEAVYGVLGLADDMLIFLFVLLHVITLYRTALVAAH
jgi:RING finger protein 170